MAVRNLISATPQSVKRFLLTTSAGVDRSDKLPFSILNLFGALLGSRTLACAPLVPQSARAARLATAYLFAAMMEARSTLRNTECLRFVGVLKWKKEGERLLQQSGLPWTIVRPNRLTDGPYTSYDLNTLLQARLAHTRPLCCRSFAVSPWLLLSALGSVN